ncbi:hypothetical protein [Kitasatospora aureofaciens]|uniref:hypothetical protein n=1 Tax=Kitasatospora aureofaciens TaxID=1894 RepID=UPI00131C2419|nr:hypothetical protein [Kitasatospora aureofaciens]
MAESRFSETIAQLEAELTGIEARRRRLEDELTGAVAREKRGAIEGLRALAGLVASQDTALVGGVRAEADAIVGDRPEQLVAEAEAEAAPERDREPAEKTTMGTDTVTKAAKKAAGKKAAPPRRPQGRRPQRRKRHPRRRRW